MKAIYLTSENMKLSNKEIHQKEKKNYNKRKLIKHLGCRLNTSEIVIITSAFQGSRLVMKWVSQN